MKRYIVSMACVIAALVSCQKNETPVETADENQPIRLTLTATIGGDDTKVAYVDEENVLKAAWEAGDKVSLLSLDISGNLLSNDVFEATYAGKSAEFEGSFTNDPATASVWVYYPALRHGILQRHTLAMFWESYMGHDKALLIFLAQELPYFRWSSRVHRM